MENLSSAYRYDSAGPRWASRYLWPPVRELLVSRLGAGARIIDVGCGNGATAAMLAELGFDVVGIDPSSTGTEVARRAYPHLRFAERSAYDDLAAEFGQFDAAVSLEVVEHCYWPRVFARNLFALLRPGGLAIVSTPFHGYWKNVALAVSGKLDAHWAPLWDGGHIKFWSERTLRQLLEEIGFAEIGFRRAGRIRPLAKSMIAVARRPG